MTFIRMTDGRDRGRVKEFSFIDAQEMVASGQAMPVDLNQPGAMEFRELPSSPEEQKPPAGIEPFPPVSEAASEAPSARKEPSGGVPDRKQPIFKRKR